MSSQKVSFFRSRMIITYCLIIWVDVIFGYWIADKLVEDHLSEKDGKSAEISVKERAPRPWVNNAKDLQNELEGRSEEATRKDSTAVTTIAPVSSNDNNLTVVPEATPTVLNNSPSDQVNEQESDSGNPSQCYILFGSFREQSTVEDMEEKLKGEGIKYSIENIPIEDGIAHRITGGPYANREAAQKVIDTLKSRGVDAYIDGEE